MAQKLLRQTLYSTVPSLCTIFGGVTRCKLYAPLTTLSCTYEDIFRWESTNLMVSYDTPLEVIEQLRIRLQAYVALNNREWSAVGVNIDKMEYQNAITLVVAMEHRPNWQDWGGRWGRRTAFMRHLKTILEELDVKYTLPIQPVLLPRDRLAVPMSPMVSSPRLRQPPMPRVGSIRAPSMRQRPSRETLSPGGDGDTFGGR